MPQSDDRLSALDAIVDDSDVVSHPFVTALASGALSRDDLRAFGTQFYRQIEALPRYATTVHSRCDDVAIRRSLLDLVVALEGRTPTLADLWLQTCAAIGLFSDSVRRATATGTTEACVNDFFFLAEGSTVSGIAALYAFLRQLPPLCAAQRTALLDHYALHNGPALEFFEVARYVASDRVRALRATLAVLVVDDQSEREATIAVQSATTALQGLIGGALRASTATSR